MLVERGFEPFGLVIGGHTSHDSATSVETSLSRAKAVSVLIAEGLSKVLSSHGNVYAIHTTGLSPVCGRSCAQIGTYPGLVDAIAATGTATIPAGSRIVSIGYGASRRLPGFEDGGNYKENRRVEVRLTQG